jgi:predicted dehydrogenase
VSAQRSQEGRTAAGRSPAGVGRHPAGLRFALIGCGFWAGAAHVPALRSLSGVDISACVGADAAEGAAFAREHGIPSSYSTLRELLAAERPDAVVVASPNDTHCEAIEASLSAGAGVFCEKPLANRGSDAWRVARAGRASGLPCTVGFSFRYSPAIQAIRNDLRSGRFGQLWLVEVAVCNSQFHPIGGKPMNWKGDPGHAGAGSLFEYGSHGIDLAQWLVGPVRRVVANSRHVLAGARLDDLATVLLEFDEPTVGSLTCGWVLGGVAPGVRVRLHGSEGGGEVELSELLPAGEIYREFSLSGGRNRRRRLPSPGVPRLSRYTASHLADFCQLLRGGNDRPDSTLPTLDQAAQVQSVLDTVLEAEERWQEVQSTPR